MESLIEITDRAVLADFFGRNRALNIYQLGDLDDFFWPHTRWFGLESGGLLRAVALLYTGPFEPTLIFLEDGNGEDCRLLLQELAPRLPARIYAHLSPGLESALHPLFASDLKGNHLKMHLQLSTGALPPISSDVLNLTIDDTRELKSFYHEVYPGNWFDPRMLETGQYFGVRDNGRLVAAGGVHVYAPNYGVAALGNIATHPDFRGRGLATHVTAGIVRSLRRTVDAIGLNVKADNAAAIACYSKLGFVEIARYNELSLVKKCA